MMMIPSSHTSARPSRGLTGQMWQANNALCVSALRTDGMMHCLFCAAFTAKCTVYDVNCAVLHSKVLSFAKGVLLCSNSVECFYNSSELCCIQVQPAELCMKKNTETETPQCTCLSAIFLVWMHCNAILRIMHFACNTNTAFSVCATPMHSSVAFTCNLLNFALEKKLKLLFRVFFANM